jgi:hypothetical protein
MLFEGWAENEEDAVRRIKAGEIKIDSALNHNTVGSGTGIITKSVMMNVIEDRRNHTVSATFPPEGLFQGGFTGWGIYSREIAENLRCMREELLPVMADALKSIGGLRIKPILAESMQMGDENHSRQTASDYLFDRIMLPAIFELDRPKDELMKVIRYILDTPRFFHCYGQGSSYAALRAAQGIEYSTMVVAACGNGVEFGIMVAGLPGQWFTAPSPMMTGRYNSQDFKKEDQIPWIGDSSVVECVGMGGFAAAACPIIGQSHGLTLEDCIKQTRSMELICLASNYKYPIPNLDFACLHVGIDIKKVVETGQTPVLHGGMFSCQGGLLGPGMAYIPMECFEKAVKAFDEKYLK